MKYIVTNAQYNARVNGNFLKNLKAFAKYHKVQDLMTFVSNGAYRDQDELDEELACFEIVDYKSLNDNLKLKDMKILAQQINPLTGLATKLSRDSSYILPSAKIRYMSVANTSNKPRAMMTTGNITKPNYKLHTAQGRKAQEQHQYGFVFVEVKNNRIFTTYQIEANQKGDFYYLNERYYEGKRSIVRPEAYILGDLHIGDTNQKAYQYSLNEIRRLKPHRVVIHDLFNGHSINPHEKGHLLSSLRSIKTRDSLEVELEEVYREVTKLSKAFPNVKFLVAESNHDIFLERYIDNKEFIDHPQNFLHIAKMIPQILEGTKPTLQIGLELFGKIPANFHFAKVDEEHRVRGVEIGQHGHKGVNGSKGAGMSFDRYNLRMITGHQHAPQLYANGMVVGTLTDLKLNYTQGPSSWMFCNGILYPDGKYGLLPFVI